MATTDYTRNLWEHPNLVQARQNIVQNIDSQLRQGQAVRPDYYNMASQFANHYNMNLYDPKSPIQNPYDPRNQAQPNRPVKGDLWEHSDLRQARQTIVEQINERLRTGQNVTQNELDLARQFADHYNLQLYDPNDPMNKYRTETGTIEDLKNKYGFDYTREYAERIAEQEARNRRQQVEHNLRQVDDAVYGALDGLDRDYFQQMRNLGQAQAESGLNAGIAADQDLRLQMAQQAAMGGVYRDAATERYRLGQQLENIVSDQALREEQLYQDRLLHAMNFLHQERGFDQQQNLAFLEDEARRRELTAQERRYYDQLIEQARQFDKGLEFERGERAADRFLDYHRFGNLSASEKAQLDWQRHMFDNLSASERKQFDWQRYMFDNISATDRARLQEDRRQFDRDLAERKRQFNSELDWRKHEFNNMSAAQKAQLELNKRQFGEEMAWRMYELEQELGFYRNFNRGGSLGGGIGQASNQRISYGKHNPPKTFQNHLQAAINSGRVPASWAAGLTELIRRESSWNPNAKNPKSTAHGYGQFLKSTRANYEKKMGLSYSDPVNQIIMMTQYIRDRYGTVDKALAFWDKNKWY